MKCPKCGGEIELGYEGEANCKNKECEYYCATYEVNRKSKKQGKKEQIGTTEGSIACDWQARAEKAEGELLSLKEKLGVGDCDYCNENKETTIAMIKKEAEELSKKLVKENQELGIKLAKAESELKAIKDNTNKFKIFELLETTFKEACIGCKYIGTGCGCVAIHNILEETTNRIIKQIGGVK